MIASESSVAIQCTLRKVCVWGGAKSPKLGPASDRLGVVWERRRGTQIERSE